jgi:serine/threonine protein phosphatase PrpC
MPSKKIIQCEIPANNTGDLENKIQQLESELDKAFSYIDYLKQSPIIIPVEQFLIIAKEQDMNQKISQMTIQLPNASQGKPYHFIFDIDSLGLSRITYFDLVGLKDCDLYYDNQTNTITGTPTQYGEFIIKLQYKFTDKDDNNPLLEKTFSLTINPDPRSLWKNLPSDETDKYFKPDSDKSLLKLADNKTIIAASQRGRSHAQEGKFRDDHFDIYHDDISKWTVVVVADGAGSAKYSRQGSLLVCDEIINYFKSLTEEKLNNLETVISEHEKADFDNPSKQNLTKLLYDYLAGAAFKAHKKLEQEAKENEANIKDYASTLVFTLFKKYDFGWFIASYGVGDSPMGIYTAGENPIIMHNPEEGEYSGQTYFLTMPEIFTDAKRAERIIYKFVPDFTAIILMTDGIYDSKFETRNNLAKIESWDKLWNDLTEQINLSSENAQLADELLTWLDFWSAGNHDDRTIAIIF